MKVNDRRRVTVEGEPREEAAAPAHEHVPHAHPDEVAKLKAELDHAHQRINELAHALQAGDRDREEFKHRLTRERERMLDVEKGNVAQTLLEAVDQLDLCLQSAADSPLARGVKLIRESVLKHAESTGIERVELVGRPYDPNLAEATDMEITPVEADDGKVTAVIRACYQLRGRVIRPGLVRVAKYVKPAQA
ncbi:MAG: nucleotide exchange factor GrpE [Myxococcaceae bacterium]